MTKVYGDRLVSCLPLLRKLAKCVTPQRGLIRKPFLYFVAIQDRYRIHIQSVLLASHKVHIAKLSQFRLSVSRIFS